MAYSSLGLIDILKANSLVSGVAIFNDLLSERSLPVAFLIMLLMCIFHLSSLAIVAPKYLYSFTEKGVPYKN